MGLIVRFHALNPTLKVRDDVPVPHFGDFLIAADAARSNTDVSGVSLHERCETCGHEDLIGNIRTERLR